MWGQLFDGFRILFSQGFVNILSMSEDRRSFMGGSDVVRCVRLSLISTTMALLWEYWSVARDCFGQWNFTLYIKRGNRAPLLL